MRVTLIALTLAIAMSLAGCGDVSTPDSIAPDYCAMALAPHPGESPLDKKISQLQGEVRRAGEPNEPLVRLGWSFIEKARVSLDAGFYKLAESAALCVESSRPGDPDALLVRGHSADSLHRFKEAEAIGRELVSRRGLHLDYGLLGDALMEQGRLDEAVSAYQQMIDLRPGPQSYSRAAHIRWLKGDLEGAIELMNKVARSAGDGEFAAWSHTRLALYQLQAGDLDRARRTCEAALALHRDFPPALLVMSRVLLAERRTVESLEFSMRAVALNPAPEYLWVLAESLSAAGRHGESRKVEEQLVQRGPAEDPRTLALYLASRGEKLDYAIDLAQREAEARQDVFTLDALAWSLTVSGRLTEAAGSMQRALSVGTEDARLFYHAGCLASEAGQRSEARRLFAKAAAIKQMLLPSEAKDLSKRIAETTSR